jgi:hypothetical protein
MYKRIFDWIGTGSTLFGFLPSTFTTTYILPPLAAIGVGLLGFFQSMPLMWIVLATIWTAIGILILPVVFLLWKYLGWPEGKLIYQSARIMRRDPLASNERYEVMLGFQLQNNAYFPMEVHIARLRTVLSNTVPPDDPFLKDSFVVDPQQTFYFDDWPIYLKAPPANCIVTGTIEFEVKYGKVGAPRLKLTKTLEIAAAIDGQGNIVGVSPVERDRTAH